MRSDLPENNTVAPSTDSAVTAADSAVTAADTTASATRIHGVESQPHAEAILTAALEGTPSHAYLFHGPEGVGKKTAARSFAAELLAAGSREPDEVRRRVKSEVHPDLNWVEPRGAHGILVEDVRRHVVGAAALTPFESARRVFVIAAADRMNLESANALLKTLEEPPSYAHIILTSSKPARLPQTVRSRCQAVRFDPVPEEAMVAALDDLELGHEAAVTVARLARGNLELARFLASAKGAELRSDVEAAVGAALKGELTGRPWRKLIERAEQGAALAEQRVEADLERALEAVPAGRERAALRREYELAAKREGRRALTETLDLALDLTQFWFRDLFAVREGVEEAALNVDRLGQLKERVDELSPAQLVEAVELCEQTKQSLGRNVAHELALEALFYRVSPVAV